jgi:hypothetical protein
LGKFSSLGDSKKERAENFTNVLIGEKNNNGTKSSYFEGKKMLEKSDNLKHSF